MVDIKEMTGWAYETVEQEVGHLRCACSNCDMVFYDRDATRVTVSWYGFEWIMEFPLDDDDWY